MDAFSTPTRRWFERHFDQPTDAQVRGWPLIASGKHVLITAPTGSGKTLAAFLWAIDQLMRARIDAAQGHCVERGELTGVRILYLSPLKALVYDVERNLRAPLAGIAQLMQDSSDAVQLPRIGIRTGDTSSQERARQFQSPPEILVTTPESLYLLLGSRAAENLRAVETIILDELHALLPSKRGAHLALSLERLAARCHRDPQRIGLSATIRPLEEAARFLGGPRMVEILDASSPPKLNFQVTVPVPDMERPAAPLELKPASGSILGELCKANKGENRESSAERGLWPAIHSALLAEIRRHRSTIIFVNSRGLCERLSHRLNELTEGGEGEQIRAHHGSVSHAQRTEIEDRLKRGDIKAIVATSSLEMGIDMGGVDQVLLVESPGSVARGLQRVGRAGHGVGEVSTGRLFPKYRGDLLECAVIAQRMLEGKLESSQMPRNALDVLAQQIVAYCVEQERRVEEIHALIAKAGPYQDTPHSAVEALLGMLSGHYPSSDFADIKPLLVWDRTTNKLVARKGASLVARLNGGTIPDRGNYAVHLGSEGPRIGELDEEMVFETKSGDCILLGASTWRVEEITRDRVVVSPAPGEPGRLPFWRGDGPGRPLELGYALGAFCREVERRRGAEAIAWIERHAPLDPLAVANLATYIEEQRQATGQVPSDRTIVVERFRDELGDWRICILSPFGFRIHAPWAMAIQAILERREGFEVQVMYTDDGIVLRFADGDRLPDLLDLLPPVEDLSERVTEQLANTAMFATLFRENAARALLMPRRSAKGRQPLWAQRLKAQNLLAAVRRYPSFPIVLETYRQALRDVFDLAGLETILQAIQSRAIRLHEVETSRASPFARSLVFAYVAAYIYEQDIPLAERRAQALTLDRSLLSELLGQAELRDLIDPRVLEELEGELQHRASGRKARDADELHDLLRRLGDLSLVELTERCEGAPEPWLALLAEQRRAIIGRFWDGPRWMAAEDAGRYRDALGVVPPSGLPDAYLAAVAQPLDDLIRRYARTHGPFPTQEPARRWALRPAQLEPVLRRLEARGELARGEIRPLGTEPEWCDPEVLRRLRRRTLARARDAVAPVDAATYARFLQAWQGIGAHRQGRDALLDALRPLEGFTLSWSLLNQVMLPARVADFRSEDLDMLAASGRLVWIGRAAAGPRDGRITILRREEMPLLSRSTVESERDAPASDEAHATPHAVLRHQLADRGASFLFELIQALDRAGFKGSDIIETTLWDLVWEGVITNDTFAPLRGLAKGPARHRRASGSAMAGGRWSLVADPLLAVSSTERLLGWARMLLERYGIVSREAVQAEALPGGFALLYPLFKQMEENGSVRRGYFVEGFSGAQFALPAAVESLRAAREGEPPLDGYGPEAVCLLAVVDPANPYGATLPWPDTRQGRVPKRIHGAHLILVAGKPLIHVAPGARQLVTFPASETALGGEMHLALTALHRLPRLARKRLAIQTIDAVPVLESALREPLVAAGFQVDGDVLVPARGWS